MSRRIRFWTFVNGSPVKLTLAMGQTIEHHVSERTDEGFYARSQSWTWEEAHEIRHRILDISRDCDGKTEHSTETAAYLADLDASATQDDDFSKENPEIAGFPIWREIETDYRDYAAERAGY